MLTPDETRFLLWAAACTLAVALGLIAALAVQLWQRSREDRELSAAWAPDYADLIEADDRWTL